MLTLPKKHFSPSQSGAYRKCGEMYRLSYIEGIKAPPAGAMLTGTGVHDGSAARHKQRMDNDTEMPRKDLIDRSVASFDERLEREGIELRGDEITVGKEIVVDKARDKTAVLAGGYADLVAPRVTNPIAVEERFDMEIPTLGITLVGIMDLTQIVEGQTAMEDLKCGKKKHGQGDVDASDQLTFYALGWLKTRGVLPDSVGLRSLRELKAGPTQDLVTGTRTDDHIKKLLRIINVVCHGISAGHFMPAPPDAWWCSEKWCGYWNMCRYRGGK